MQKCKLNTGIAASGGERKERRLLMDLSKASTRELVEELSKREAVETISVKPYEKYVIEADGKKTEDEGPVVILKIWD